MTRFRLVLLSALCLILTTPWFFSGSGSAPILGFPPWAFYSLCATVVYAVVIAALLQFYWDVLAGDPEEE